MKNLICIIALFHFGSTEIIAQTKSDSLYVFKIDSIIEARYNKDFWGTELQQKKLEDSTDYKTVIGRSKNGLLVDISYYESFGGCESATFYLVDSDLMMVEYKIDDPDLYSEGPPSVTYKVYFRENQAIMQSTSSYQGGPGPLYCTSYNISKKDFLKELSYYRQLLLND
jgi:hypothetical protein